MSAFPNKPNQVADVRGRAISEAFKGIESAAKHIGYSGTPFNAFNPASVHNDTTHLDIEARMKRLERIAKPAIPTTIKGYFEDTNKALLYNAYIGAEETVKLQRLNAERQESLELAVRPLRLSHEEEADFVEELHLVGSLGNSDPTMEKAGAVVERVYKERRKDKKEARKSSNHGGAYRPLSAPPGLARGSYVDPALRQCHWCRKVGHQMAECPDRAAGISRLPAGPPNQV
jgi:hypothetical protein